jgi:hypothetical protein
VPFPVAFCVIRLPKRPLLSLKWDASAMSLSLCTLLSGFYLMTDVNDSFCGVITVQNALTALQFESVKGPCVTWLCTYRKT